MKLFLKRMSNQHFGIIPLLLLVLFSACGPLLREAENERAHLPELDPRWGGVSVKPGTRQEILSKLYSPLQGTSACSFVDQLASQKAALPGSRFRLLGAMAVGATPRDEEGRASAKKNCFTQCLPFYWGSGACKRCKEERDEIVPVFSLDGRVDISASPLYQYGLMTQEIPDRRRFLELVEEEIESQPYLTTPLARIYKWLLKADLVSLYGKRNEIIQERINESLPGTFDVSAQIYSLRKSFPETLLRNGMPMFSKLAPLPNDSSSVKEKKARELQGILSAYSKSLPLFHQSGKWSHFEDEMQRGMNVALAAFNSQSAREQACGTVILHRAFSELITIAGYDRPPMAIDDPRKQHSSFPQFSQMLDKSDGTQFRVCPMAGAFGKNGYRRTLYARDLETFDSEKDQFNLMKTAPLEAICTLSESVPQNSSPYRNYKKPRLREEASGEELLSFTSGLAHFMISFNPGAQWWTTSSNVTGFPLASFDDVNDVKSSGGILPIQSHALSLALLNIAMDRILDKHLLLIGEKGNETDQESEAFGLRFSDKARNSMSGGKVVTSVKAATLAIETVLKFSASLEKLSDWRYEAARRLKADLSQEKDSMRREAIGREYSNFIKGMFGNSTVFELLTATGGDSLRSKLSKAELAVALLGSSFAKKNAKGEISCYNQLINDFDGVGYPESKLGECSPEDARRWKKAMSQVAILYSSPLFAEFGALDRR